MILFNQVMVHSILIFLQVLVPEIMVSMTSRCWHFIMENGTYQEYKPEELSEVPPLIKHISSIEVVPFDGIEEGSLPNNHSPSTLPTVSSYTNHVYLF